MSIKRSSYDGLNWVDALKARKEPRDYETRLASANEEDVLDEALEQTVEAVFNVPTTEETSEEAISRVAKSSADQARAEADQKAVSDIKKKLSNRDEAIDPVALGVKVNGEAVTREQWDNAANPVWTEHVAKLAALAFKNKKDTSWQQEGMKTQRAPRSIEASRDGRLMPSHSEGDDQAPRFSKVPVNANSIADPGRIDRLAQEAQNQRNQIEDDKRKAKASKEQKARSEREQAIKGVISNSDGSRVIPSGGKDADAFIQKVPSNQVSMTDDLSKGLEALFLEKLQDSGTEIKEAAKERRESIRSDRESEKKKDRKNWDKLSKPLTTSALQERLINLWIPDAKGE